MDTQNLIRKDLEKRIADVKMAESNIAGRQSFEKIVNGLNVDIYFYNLKAVDCLDYLRKSGSYEYDTIHHADFCYKIYHAILDMFIDAKNKLSNKELKESSILSNDDFFHFLRDRISIEQFKKYSDFFYDCEIEQMMTILKHMIINDLCE
jgi:hypothetical protein